MNIEQAKRIPLSLISEKIVSVVEEENIKDFVDNLIKTDVLDAIQFVSAYLEWSNNSYTTSDSLRWLSNMFEVEPDCKLFNEEQSALVLKNASEIEHQALINYITEMYIPLDVAKRYLCELKVLNRDTGNHFSALGFKNEEGGYEVINKFYKGYIAPRDILFIRGTIPKPESIHIFKNIMDYISLVMMQEGVPFEGDAIILSSYNKLPKKAFPYIKSYGYKNGYTWMPNNSDGLNATKSFHSLFKKECVRHFAMNKKYRPHGYPSEWYRDQCSQKYKY